MVHNPLIRRAALATYDALCWALAALVILVARYDFAVSVEQAGALAWYVGFAACVMVALGYATKMYRGRYRVASFDEALGVGGLAIATGLGSLVTFVVLGDSLPRGVAFLTPIVALIFMLGGRWAFRVVRTNGRSDDTRTKNVLIFGAGDAGHQLLRVILTDRNSEYNVRGFIDDNPAKRNLRLVGVPVVGTRSEMVSVARQLDVEAVILAVSRMSGPKIAEIQDEVESADLEFLAVPRLSELIGGQVKLEDVRHVEIADVLGRGQVSTDISAIASYLSGRRVLITGAGGSIGSELARQVHKFGPADLVLLDRDESALHGVQLSIYGQALLNTPDMALCDIRDLEALRAIFAAHRPEIVFHAAALKHLPMLEQYPEEGWKTNVIGTQNLLALAGEFEVGHFVNVSTDKAAAPTSVLGATKRIAEQLTASAAQSANGAYMSVRFGNVLGSRGSMLHTFNSQIDAGGPITVTHPDITRYFMTIPEACELVIQAGAIGEGGNVYVLDMGIPVKILDVAKRMIAASGKKIEIVFTGLRPGEKMHEVLFSEEETGTKTDHPLVTCVPVPTMSDDELAAWHDRVTTAR